MTKTVRNFWDTQSVSSVDYLTGTILMLPYYLSNIWTQFPGFLYCDGTALSRTTYSTLYAKIGIKYGYTSSSTFRLPDYRGMFIRARDNGGGVDPDISSRTVNPYSTGVSVGSKQNQQIKSHRHYTQYDNNTTGGVGWADDNANRYQNINTGWSGSTETRPRNYSMIFLIKYN